MAQKARRLNQRDVELLIKRVNKQKKNQSYITILSWERPYLVELEEKEIFKFWTYVDIKDWIYSLST